MVPGRWYAVAAGVLVVTFLLWPGGLRHLPFLLVALSALPCVAVALRRAAPGERLSWWLMLAALLLYNVGNIIWTWMVIVEGRVTGDDTVAGVFLTGGGVLVLCAALAVVVQRGRRDIGGLIDSVVTALALTGLFWDSLLLPALADQHVTTSREIVVFVHVFVMAGTMGALLRISFVGPGERAPVRLLTGAVGLGLLGSVVGALAIDPSTGARASWTDMIYLAAYALLGCAALHPGAGAVAAPGEPPADRLSRRRLLVLGLMIGLAPLTAGIRGILGLPLDGLILAFTSVSIVPLVMIRVERLSSARDEAEQALVRLATRDGLTGLPNRAAGVEHIAAELQRGPGELAVLFCDLDGFKPVNDRLGHAAGDRLLAAVADRLRGCVRQGDLVFRLGGDEFVIACSGVGALDEICARIRGVVSTPFPIAGEQVRIGVSAGYAVARDGDTADNLISRADLAMYEAKRTKRAGSLSVAAA
ncbi:GGDEF domain-containing protein [Actinoplanes sp. KI2]|uniref:GGDEF domain-containing protein n=1 Tax=Actinoplanes sp. KI2 TaxID=2983315 RepID=UPI0021D5B880|nr:GGDEF domain-containing protein [Actinoplanes sp. KI2]MCU7723037.1 GGDEF domain-containing protein [Actinoplanes sp. KI2]